MRDDSVDPGDRRSTRGGLIAQLLLLLLITSCTAGLARSSPTPPAPPDFPALTPIMPQGEPSPTPEAPPTVTVGVTPTPDGDAGEDGDGGQAGVTHTVQPGDTLLELARRYGVPMAAIQLENRMGESTVLKAGQTLAIPPREDWDEASAFWIVHEVQANETLIGIGRTYDVEVDRLQAVNGLDDADRITVGQLLILPLDGPAAAPAPEPTAAPPPTATLEPAALLKPTATSSQESSTVSASSAAPTAGPAAHPPTSLGAWPQQIAQMINEVRAQHGLPPYTYNEILEKAAQAHANDCAGRGWCSHTGTGGTSVKTRVLRAGYEATGWAECWAQTQTPQRAVEVWMDETPPNDPHRRTLLSDWFTEIGIGVAKADWGHYIIADFGRP